MDTLGLLVLAGIVIYIASNQNVLANILPTGSTPGGGNVPPPTQSAVQTVALAIANAEGFNVQGSLAQVNNNPGNIGGGSATYPTPADGWNALYDQITKIFNNTSGYYNSGMTIDQVGYIYADGAHDPAGAANWSANVAAYLGVPSSTTFDQLATML